MDQDGTVWVSTWSGVCHFDGNGWTCFGPQGITFADLAIASDGTLWGCRQNLSAGLYHLVDGEWTTYTAADGLIDNSVVELAVGPGNSVWFATEAGVTGYVPGE